jgi:hypothetical protein
MHYRYGDATPFPLEENFIDTLVALTDTCVKLFQAEVAAEERRAQARQLHREAAEELARLDALEKAVEGAVAPLLPPDAPTTSSEAAAVRIAQASDLTLKQARAAVIKRRDAAVQATLTSSQPEQARLLLGEFLLPHKLPKTQWSVRWTSGHALGEGRAELHATTPQQLDAAFACDIPREHMWAGPIRLADLAPQLCVMIQREGGWLRGGVHRKRERLHRFFVTRVEHTPTRYTMTIKRALGRPSTGFEILVRGGETSGPVITCIDTDDRAVGAPMALDADDAAAVMRVWHKLEAAIADLIAFRREIRAASLQGKPVTGIEHPGDLAETMLMAVAPVVREMRLRSRVPGELILKRDLGDGRREELFVPRRLLQRKFAALPDRYRRFFEAMGLGSEATMEFATREYAAQPAPSSSGTTAVAEHDEIDAAQVTDDSFARGGDGAAGETDVTNQLGQPPGMRTSPVAAA